MRNRVCVSHQTIQDKPYIDIRQLFYSEDDDSWHRTKKGVTLATAQAMKLRDALDAALSGGQYVDPALAGDGGDEG